MKNNSTRFTAGLVLSLVAVFGMGIATSASAMLTRTLDLGDSGSDVSTLQTYLSSDPTMYPSGLVTGYYGQLTKAGIERFQTRNSIVSYGTPATTGYGRVGPITLSALNTKMSGGVLSGSDIYAPSINSVAINTSNTNATVSWSMNEAAQGAVYYSSTPLVTYERENSVDVSGSIARNNTSLSTSHTISISGLQANTTYYYMIYVTDASGNVSVTVPSSFRTAN